MNKILFLIVTLSFTCGTTATLCAPPGIPDIQATDRVVYLSGLDNGSNFIGFQNRSEYMCQGGMCGGVTNVQFALLSSIAFQGNVPVDSDKIITKKIIKATETKELQTINGYSSLNEFIETVKQRKGLNPVTEAIIDIQSRLQISNVGVSEGTVISSYSARRQNARPAPFQWSGIPNAIEQAAMLVRQIDAKHPSKIVISDANSKGIAHAVTVVGYVQSEGESYPSKILVIDPNYPETTKSITVSENVWNYEGRKVGALVEKATSAQNINLEKVMDKVEVSGHQFKGIPGLTNNFPCQDACCGMLMFSSPSRRDWF